ncbi:MAG: hypothetical protein JXR49_08910 [Acidobacteria bacterium]|nr:hypothetical protein [Acidobacteriota bacterium]
MENSINILSRQFFKNLIRRRQAQPVAMPAIAIKKQKKILMTFGDRPDDSVIKNDVSPQKTHTPDKNPRMKVHAMLYL